MTDVEALIAALDRGETRVAEKVELGVTADERQVPPAGNEPLTRFAWNPTSGTAWRNVPSGLPGFNPICRNWAVR